jgi:hypothetical protein
LPDSALSPFSQVPFGHDEDGVVIRGHGVAAKGILLQRIFRSINRRLY